MKALSNLAVALDAPTSICLRWSRQGRCATDQRRQRPYSPYDSLPRVLVSLQVAAILCSGCMVIRHTDSPGANGVIVDSASRQPVQGVEVAMSYASEQVVTLTNALVNFRPPITLTDATGGFSVPAQTSVTFETIFAFPWWLRDAGTTNSALWGSGTLVLRHKGYEPKLIHVFAKRTCDLGVIKIQPDNP